jgi:hypothetical protein
MEEKESYCGRVEERLKDLGAQVDEMMWKTKDFARKARKSYKKNAQKLRENIELASDKINEMRKTSGNSWQDLKEGLEQGMKEVENGFEKAVQEFKLEETNIEKKAKDAGV